MATAALVVALAISLCGCGAQARTGEGPAETVPVAAPVEASSEVRGRLVLVDLTSADDGVAIVGDCSSQGQEADRCVQRVAVAEGGAHWQARQSPLPAFTTPAGYTASLAALGPGRAVIWTPPDKLTGTTRWRQWFTRDGARSWREVGMKVAGTTATIPANGRLIAADKDPDRAARNGLADQVDPATWRILVLDPETGLRKELATQPRLAEARVISGVPESDGSWWLSGKDPRTGDPAIGVSRDNGRTWNVSRLDAPRDGLVSIVVGAGSTYAVVTGSAAHHLQAQNALLAILRSTDGGRTWKRVWSFRQGREPMSGVGAFDAGGGCGS